VPNSIAIIGAGIAGLSAGCYARMNGYDVHVFEAHTQPGGLCTSWRRGDYTIDGCIQWLVGANPRGPLNRVWRELGALKGRRVVDHPEFTRIEGAGGRTLILYADVSRLERHLLDLSPADSGPIRELCDAIRLFTRFEPPMDKPLQMVGLFDGLGAGLKMLPFLGPLMTWSRTTLADFAGRFRDPFLRATLPLLFPLPDFPMLGMITTLAWVHNRDAGVPIGGSLEFARAIERRLLGLGGRVTYGARVERVLVDGGRAVGVRTAVGAEHRADYVISAADGHATIFDMLGGKHISQDIRGHYDSLPTFRSLIQVTLGVARDLSSEPHSVTFPLPEPIEIAGELRTLMGYRHSCHDPSLAPAGKSIVQVSYDSDLEWWQPLTADPARYEAEKRSIADVVIAALDRRFPGLACQVEMVDVATPVAFHRYTSNWKGSIEGWHINTKTIQMTFGGGMPKTLPGLDCFYMAGQWVEPGGGVPAVAISGRNVVQFICDRDRRRFVTSEA
jgi:phytoene dehydrogenase-like protein